MGEVVLTVVEALADEKGVEPEEMTPPLEEVVDVDVLERLLRTESVRVTFEYDGYEVTVTGTDEVTVAPSKTT